MGGDLLSCSGGVVLLEQCFRVVHNFGRVGYFYIEKFVFSKSRVARFYTSEPSQKRRNMSVGWIF